jgi:hypothetical protein
MAGLFQSSPELVESTARCNSGGLFIGCWNTASESQPSFARICGPWAGSSRTPPMTASCSRGPGATQPPGLSAFVGSRRGRLVWGGCSKQLPEQIVAAWQEHERSVQSAVRRIERRAAEAMTTSAVLWSTSDTGSDSSAASAMTNVTSVTATSVGGAIAAPTKQSSLRIEAALPRLKLRSVARRVSSPAAFCLGVGLVPVTRALQR